MTQIHLGIDASNLRSGGGLTHISQLLHAVQPDQAGIEKITIWGGTPTLAKLPDVPWLTKAHSEELDQGLRRRAMWQQNRLPETLQELGCHGLFSPGGTLPSDCPVPTVTMSQNLLVFEPQEAARYPFFSRVRLRLRVLQRMQRKSMSQADGLIFLTDYARRTVLKALPTQPSETAVIAHGIEERFYEKPRPARSMDTLSDEAPFELLYVSIIDVYKHQWTVARAVADLHKRGLPVRITFVGPSYPLALKRFERVRKKVDPQGLFLQYPGSMPFEELHEAYKKADAFVFASSCENLPIILLEAMAAGLPIACAERGPMPEVLGDAGLYFNPEDAGSTAESLAALIKDPQKREALAEKSYERARAYSWAKCAQETLSFVAGVVRKTPSKEQE
jgi:glycosyltransferase involved in cell wall biosynthesis